jgi:xanthine dehydrogenase accessory factor
MPSLRLVVIGAVHISQVLVPMARLAGFHVTLVDPRRAFATATRFVDTRIVRQWPDRYFESEPLDADTAVVSLSHDSKIDDLALIAALKSPACYVGALGSRKTHARRLSRLEDAGMTPAALARIHAPIGLDLGGRSASDIAIAILAEIVSVRSGPGPVSKPKKQHG